jgi:hypothetical protein|nr:hypothetical protein [Pandoraea eparura]
MRWKRVAQSLPVVVVADDQIDGQPQRRQTRVKYFVFRWIWRVNQVAGRDDGVGRRRPAIDRGDRAAQGARGINACARKHAGPRDVESRIKRR